MSAEVKWQDSDQLIFYGLLIGAIQRQYPRRLTFFLPVMPKVEDRLFDIEFSNNDFLKMYTRIKDLISMWDECMSSKGFGQIRDKNKRGFQVPKYLSPVY